MKKIDPTVLKETGYIAAMVFIFSLALQSVFLIIGKWDYTVLTGNLLGFVAAVGNFFLMGLSVQSSLGKEEKDIEELVKMAWNTVSLNSIVGDEEDTELGDFIADEETITPYKSAEIAMLRDSIYGLLDTLSDREAAVIKMRFGLEGNSMTLEEVGKEFNVTRERIRQIEAKALRKLRHPSRSRKLKDYLD